MRKPTKTTRTFDDIDNIGVTTPAATHVAAQAPFAPKAEPAGETSNSAPAVAREKQFRHVPIRLLPGDWKRLHDYCLTHNTSIQQLAVAGMSRLLQESGLPPLEGIGPAIARK